MPKINSFIFENIETLSDSELRLAIRNGRELKVYSASFPIPGSVVFSNDLELLMMQPDFNFHKEFLKLISDYRSGAAVQFPVDLTGARACGGSATVCRLKGLF
jgi:hypothetical protein